MYMYVHVQIQYFETDGCWRLKPSKYAHWAATNAILLI